MAFANQKEKDHDCSLALMNKLRLGEFGTPYTSDYVFDEAVTTAYARTGRVTSAIKVGKIILGSEYEAIPSFVKLVRVDERNFAEALRIFATRKFESLSFTDHTILVQLKELKIDNLVSFDSAFDGLAARVQ